MFVLLELWWVGVNVCSKVDVVHTKYGVARPHYCHCQMQKLDTHLILTNYSPFFQASFNPVAYIGNPRLGTALQLLQTTDYIESKLHEVRNLC